MLSWPNQKCDFQIFLLLARLDVDLHIYIHTSTESEQMPLELFVRVAAIYQQILMEVVLCDVMISLLNLLLSSEGFKHIILSNLCFKLQI